jgi:tripartite motif-containing protein 37
MKDKAIVYSPIIEQEGLEWRLKVYPNGNESV